MITVNISYDVPQSTVNKIADLLNETENRDVNWNGAQFTIERGDHTCIDGDDSYNAVALLIKINRLIDGQ